MKRYLFISIVSILLSGCNNSSIEGEYVNVKDGLYDKIEFEGKTSCVVTGGIFGVPYSTSYVKDGNIIRIKTDKSDLMFRIKDSKTLIGEGFAEGTYKKTSSFKSKNKPAIGYYKTKSGLNVRAGPGTDYKKIETLSKGTRVKVISNLENDWCKIEKDGYAGYVSKNYLIQEK